MAIAEHVLWNTAYVIKTDGDRKGCSNTDVYTGWHMKVVTQKRSTNCVHLMMQKNVQPNHMLKFGTSCHSCSWNGRIIGPTFHSIRVHKLMVTLAFRHNRLCSLFCCFLCVMLPLTFPHVGAGVVGVGQFHFQISYKTTEHGLCLFLTFVFWGMSGFVGFGLFGNGVNDWLGRTDFSVESDAKQSVSEH